MTRRKKLTGEERALWSKVARTTKPLPGRMEALLSSSAETALKLDKAKPDTPEHEKTGLTRATRYAIAAPFRDDRSKTGGVQNREPRAAARRLHPIEKPVHRKLARGRLPLEARIDLHGLDQAEAHRRLVDFIHRAHSRGVRHVLVITGKGASLGSEGALKRALPQWLAKPELATVVSGFEIAGRGHGGEGAFYVRLKKRKRRS